GAGPRARRDHRGGHGDRERPGDRRVAVPVRLHDPGGHRQRVPRGLHRSSQVGAAGVGADAGRHRPPAVRAVAHADSPDGHDRWRDDRPAAARRGRGYSRGGRTVSVVAAGIPVRSISRVRKAKDRTFTIALWVCGGLALLPLLFIATYVVLRGWAQLKPSFFLR